MKIVAVCLGNICRSPIAHGLLLQKAAMHNLDWEIDSAGTSGYHRGAAPHQDSQDICLLHGLDISNQRSRKFSKEDLDYYDLILVMDASNYQNVMCLCEKQSQRDKIKMILNFVTPGRNQGVPDPYYEGGFDKVYDILDEATDKVVLSMMSEKSPQL